MRFNLDQLFEEEPLKEEPIVTQEKIKVQEQEKPTWKDQGQKWDHFRSRRRSRIKVHLRGYATYFFSNAPLYSLLS